MVALYSAWSFYRHITEPTVPGPTQKFVVPKGATGQRVGHLLAEAGLLEHEVLLRAAFRLSDSKEDIKYGVYPVPEGLSAMQLLDFLRDASNQIFEYENIPDAVRITIPEGLTIAQTARLFENPQAFIDATVDPAVLECLGIEADSCEGFLMPNTYFFSEAPTEATIVERMVQQFEQDYAGLLEQIPDVGEIDKMKVVIVASLVEEEARVDSERSIVAAVIYNRLKNGRALELDSTLQYALGKYGERLLAKDKEVDSPYNTYRNAGLPPGPISNPGAASVRAALAPADVDYLYFVSNADGKTHTFSTTLQEHNRAVAKYRRDIAKQRRELRRQRQESQN